MQFVCLRETSLTLVKFAYSPSAVLSRLFSRYTTKKTRRVTYVLHDLRPQTDPSLDSALSEITAKPSLVGAEYAS